MYKEPSQNTLRNPLECFTRTLCKVLTHIAVSMQQHSFFSYSGKGGAGQHKFSHTRDFMQARVNQHLYWHLHLLE
jgi:hypothetical protein